MPGKTMKSVKKRQTIIFQEALRLYLNTRNILQDHAAVAALEIYSLDP